MQKSQAIAIIANAMQYVTSEKRYHQTLYAAKCYDHLIDLYAKDGFRHMPAVILQAIERDSRCVYSIALEY